VVASVKRSRALSQRLDDGCAVSIEDIASAGRLRLSPFLSIHRRTSRFFRGESVDLVGSCRSKRADQRPGKAPSTAFSYGKESEPVGWHIGARWWPSKAGHTAGLQMPASDPDSPQSMLRYS